MKKKKEEREKKRVKNLLWSLRHCLLVPSFFITFSFSPHSRYLLFGWAKGEEKKKKEACSVKEVRGFFFFHKQRTAPPLLLCSVLMFCFSFYFLFVSSSSFYDGDLLFLYPSPFLSEKKHSHPHTDVTQLRQEAGHAGRSRTRGGKSRMTIWKKKKKWKEKKKRIPFSFVFFFSLIFNAVLTKKKKSTHVCMHKCGNMKTVSHRTNKKQ